MNKNGLVQILQELKKKAIEHYGANLVSLVVFGSQAVSLSTPESDVDLLIVLERSPRGNYERYTQFLKIEEQVEISAARRSGRAPVVISPIIKSRKTLQPYLPWLWNTEFKILFDKDGFFAGFIPRIKEFQQGHLLFVKEPQPHYSVIKEW